MFIEKEGKVWRICCLWHTFELWSWFPAFVEKWLL